MDVPERIVCCTLCLCMALSVFSSVALVYLTALVYMPAKREMMSGLSDMPVMCTTIERSVSADCDWYSCGEWCLSRSSQCVKLWAHVRKNGTNVALSGCSVIQDVTCLVLDDDFVEETSCSKDYDCAPLNAKFFDKCQRYNDCGTSSKPFQCDTKAGICVSVRQHRNCKVDNHCTDLNDLFMCTKGLCQNITSVHDCTYTTTDPPLNCKDKRNCIGLHGLYHCHDGQCFRIHWPWHCERRCASVATHRSRNVIFLSGDQMVSASCAQATTSNGQTELWRSGHDPTTIFMASCTNLAISEEAGQIMANDCVNGTLIPRLAFGSRLFNNFTKVHQVFQEFGRTFPLDRDLGHRIPFDTDITIYNRTKVLLNTEGCVNTLQHECTQFYLDHRRDGRNYSRQDRYPCYYTPTHGDFVVTRFSLERTRHVFLLAFAIPASLWLFSCSCLFGCSKVLRVHETTGQMQILCRRHDWPEDDDSEDEFVEPSPRLLQRRGGSRSRQALKQA